MANRAYLIPTPSESTPIATQRTSLSGRNYRLDFKWNSRRELWELSIFDDIDEPVAIGLALVHGWDILNAVSIETRPPGSLIVYASEETDSTLESLATDAFYYIVDEELDEAL